MTFRIPRDESPVFREASTPPGVEAYRGRTPDGAFVCRLEIVAGEVDGDILAALIAFTERVERRRAQSRRLRLVSAS